MSQDLTALLQEGFMDVNHFAATISDDAFYRKPAPEVWSPAENVQHLIQSVAPLVKLFGRPKEYFIEKWGQPDWTSRSYEQVYDQYHQALQIINQRPGGLVQMVEANPDKAELMLLFNETNAALLAYVEQWEAEALDAHIIPHPAMGPLTVREMLLFTALHTKHHLAIMQKRAGLSSAAQHS